MNAESPPTTLPRATLAIAAGIIAAGLANMLYFMLAQLVGDHTLASFSQWGSLYLPLFMAGMTTFGTGLLFVGVPCWWLMHRKNYRQAHHAAALGFGLSFVQMIIFHFTLGKPVPSLMAPPPDTVGFILNACSFSLMGALVGLVIWRVAYGTKA